MGFFGPIEVKVAVVTGLVSLIAGAPNAIALLDDSSSKRDPPRGVPQASKAAEVGLSSCVTVHRQALSLMRAYPRLRARYAFSGDATLQGLAPLNSREEARRCGPSERLVEADVPARGGGP
jgi:hypothetical protein